MFLTLILEFRGQRKWEKELVRGGPKVGDLGLARPKPHCLGKATPLPPTPHEIPRARLHPEESTGGPRAQSTHHLINKAAMVAGTFIQLLLMNVDVAIKVEDRGVVAETGRRELEDHLAPAARAPERARRLPCPLLRRPEAIDCTLIWGLRFALFLGRTPHAGRSVLARTVREH